MNRRSLLGFLASTPLAFLLPKSLIAAEPVTLSLTPRGVAAAEMAYSPIPIGFMRDYFVTASGPFNGPAPAICKKHIWNGYDWVDFDSPEGTAVLNKVLPKTLRIEQIS